MTTQYGFFIDSSRCTAEGGIRWEVDGMNGR